jgi:histidinol-phosphatase (PHP family)
MYLTDFHMHTLCSPDGNASLSQMADGAVEAGLSEICMTDHCDLMDLEGNFTPAFSWAPLEAEYASRPEVPGLKIRFGIELGEAPEDFTAANKIASHPKLDFVIGSQHNLSRNAGGADYYFTKYTSKDQCYRDLDDYFAQLYLLAEENCYDVLGHIPYPLRYMRSRDRQDVSLDRYRDQIAAIFQAAISKGKGIEVNTNRGRSLTEWMPLLQLYRDLGGEIITVGSDAHRPDHVGLGVFDAYCLLERTKFRYVAVYERHVPQFYPVYK